MEPAKKKISPIAINALIEALTNIYWYKRDLKSFIHNTITNPSVINKLNWDNYKRDIVNQLVSFFVSNEDKLQSDLLILITEVCNMNDFSHLERIEDGVEKARLARQSVEALRKQIDGYQGLVKELELQRERRVKAMDKIKKTQNFHADIDNLRSQFLDLVIESNAQKRGFKLEGFIKELFKLHDLDPKASFRIKGEQIDGAFTFDNTDYLFEAKWQKEPIGVHDLDAFNGKLSRKLDNTLGLFLSIDGFSPDGISAYNSGGRRLMYLMDGCDLMGVLDGRIDLLELLRRKRRYASQTGNVFFSISDIILDK